MQYVFSKCKDGYVIWTGFPEWRLCPCVDPTDIEFHATIGLYDSFDALGTLRSGQVLRLKNFFDKNHLNVDDYDARTIYEYIDNYYCMTADSQDDVIDYIVKEKFREEE
jgi:hypothetical protein